MVSSSKTCNDCSLAAYVDGDLDDQASALVEEHLAGCSRCRAELRAHRLFLCELDAAMTQKPDVSIPLDFSRIVAARAASDMGGVRSTSEHRKALAFCIGLAVSAFVLLGASPRQWLFSVPQRGAVTVFRLLSFVWTAFYDMVASVTVISRVMSRKFVIESGSLSLLLVLFALAIVLLTRLISNYHRARAID
jgi:anti-sigma factor RsiW